MLDTLVDTIYSMAHKSMMDYSILEGSIGTRTLVYRDGSMATIIKYLGVRRITGDDEMNLINSTLASTLNPFFKSGAHELHTVYDCDTMTPDSLKRRIKPMYDTAARLGFDEVVNDIFDEQVNTMSALTMDDSMYIVLTTHSSALRKDDYAEWVKNLIQERQKGSIHVPPGTQDETYAIDPLLALHDAYVDQVHGALTSSNVGAMCTVLDVETASMVMAQSIDPLGTPEGWRAWMLPTSDQHIARRRQSESLTKVAPPSITKSAPNVRRIANTAVFFPPPLKEQIISQEGSYIKNGGYLEYAGRIYSTLYMTIPPRKEVRVAALISSLAKMQTRSADGKSQRAPYRLSTKLRGNGMKLLTWRSMVAPFFSAGSAKNAKLIRAASSLGKEANNDMAIASISLSLTTWVDASAPNAIQQLKQRVVALRSAASQWGDMQVVEDTLDRAQAFLASAPGLSMVPCGAVEGVGTLNDLLPLFPWNRPASPLGNGGVEMYRSMDGSLLPTEAHSSQQDYWLETMTAPMGGGKSAQANRKHFDFIFAPGRRTLPFLHIMDIGGSVSGMVEMIQDALPKDLKRLAMTHTLHNNRENAINMLDPKLGLRYPLDGDMNAIVDWLTAVVTPAERKQPYDNMSEFCRVVLLATYKQFDDGRDQSSARMYKPGNEKIDQALAQQRIDIKPGTSWYAVADQLGVKGRIEEAILAHRKAVPLLADLHNVSQDQNVRGDFMEAKTEQGTSIPEAFAVQLALARESYPIFTDETCFDLRGARITAIDLAEVTPQGSAGSRKQSSLMYQVAYELFSKNIRITPNDLKHVPKAWQTYYQNLLQEIANTDKHIAIDEYHRTIIQEGDEEEGSHDTQGLRATLIREGGRESRKWALSLTTMSQESKDHGKLFQMASGNHILKVGGSDEIEFQTKALSLSRSDSLALRHFVTGPKKGQGVTFLSRWTTKDGPFNQLFTSTMGPKMLWALSSTFEDKTIRGIVYEALGRMAGRAILAKHYPGGTAKDEVERRKLSSGKDANDADALAGACQEIANELIGIYRANPGSTD